MLISNIVLNILVNICSCPLPRSLFAFMLINIRFDVMGDKLLAFSQMNRTVVYNRINRLNLLEEMQKMSRN